MWYVNNFVNSFFVWFFFIILIVNVFLFFSFPSPLFHALRHCIRKNLKSKKFDALYQFYSTTFKFKACVRYFLKTQDASSLIT